MFPNMSNCPLTLNTTRVCGTGPIDLSIEVSKMVYTFMKPKAVILVNKNEIFDAIAAAPLVHTPIDASLLITDGDRLRRETLEEIIRLSPKGYDGTHVFLVGNISMNMAFELADYGLKARYIAGCNHYETACMIPEERNDFKNLIITSGEYYHEGIMTPYWSAHHGDPILFVKKDYIPDCTLDTITKMHDINIYIIGSTMTVSECIEDALSQSPNVKHLDRISGESPYDIAVNFAKYQDHKTEFGWGRDYKEGHAFTFGTLNNPMNIIAGVLFSHMGKHTPLLLTKSNSVPDEVKNYIKSVKPIPPKKMPRPPFMHGYILGDTSKISYSEQVKLEDILSIDPEIMDMDKM
ncbi:MAG: cell wall-binding repeat-containing protein [Clostridiaceae bacterium]